MDEGYILDKRIGIGQPHRIEDAKILVANTPMDTDKIKIYGARVRVDSMMKVRVPTMRFGSTAKVLLKCKLKYYRISECPLSGPVSNTARDHLRLRCRLEAEVEAEVEVQT